MDELHQIDNSNLGILWQRIRTFVMALLTCKADRSTTLSGYGITDAYTKSDVDDIIEQIELTPGPQGEQGEKGDKGDTGATGIGIGLQGELDVTIEITHEEGSNINYVQSIPEIDDITERGLYLLHSSEGAADSILSVERISDDNIIQYVMVGGFVGINTNKFIYRTYYSGEWSEWVAYDICSKKQDVLHSGKDITIKIGEVLLHIDEDKLTKLKNFLEE